MSKILGYVEEIRKARETILPLFIDKYGRTKKTPYLMLGGIELAGSEWLD